LRKVYIGQLGYKVEEQDIKDKFRGVGDIESVNIIRDRESGQSKGFGFIQFANEEDAVHAIKTLNGTSLDGRPCRLGHAEHGRGKTPGAGGGGGRDEGGGGRSGGGGGGARYGGRAGPAENKVFIAKLAPDATEDEVRKTLGKAGEIIDCEIIKDRETNESRGFGFVKFAERADADDCVKNFDGVEIAGRPVRLEKVGQEKRGGSRDRRSRSRKDSRSRSRKPSPRRDSRSRSLQRPSGRKAPVDDRRRDNDRDDRDRRDDRQGGRDDDRGRDRDRDRSRDRDDKDRRDDRRDDRDDRRDGKDRDGSRDRRDSSRDRGGRGSGGRGSSGGRRGGGGSSRSRSKDVPKKTEALQAAKKAFEDSQAAVKKARVEAAAAEAALKKMERAAEQIITRTVSETTKLVKAELNDKTARMKKDSGTAMTDALEDSELTLRQELAQKVADVRKEYETKIEKSSKRIQKEWASKIEDELQTLQEDGDAKIEEAQRKADKEEAPLEWRESHESAETTLKQAEERLSSTKKRYEGLSGEKAPSMERDPRSGAAAKRKGGGGGAKANGKESEYSEASDDGR